MCERDDQPEREDVRISADVGVEMGPAVMGGPSWGCWNAVLNTSCGSCIVVAAEAEGIAGRKGIVAATVDDGHAAVAMEAFVAEAAAFGACAVALCRLAAIEFIKG